MSNAEMIVFNGIYVQQPGTGLQSPVYKHESRQQYIHKVVVDGLPHWRVGVPSVGAQGDFIDYLSTPSLLADDDDMTSPDMTSRWYVWSAHDHSWSLAGRVSATCVEPDFVTCTSGLLSVSGLSVRHQRWHGMRMGIYRATSLTNQLRPVYKSVVYCTLF